jgi:DNA-binding MarR family transcriptional regulator
MSESERAGAMLGDYRVEDQVGFLLRRANQRHTAIFAEGMVEADLTPTQFTALVKVVEHGQVTQNLLGRLAAMDPATIQGVVRRLIDRGLVARADDPLDRRTIVLAPTDAGVRLAGRAVVAARRITEATLEPLSTEDRVALMSLLRKIA